MTDRTVLKCDPREVFEYERPCNAQEIEAITQRNSKVIVTSLRKV